MKRIDRKERAKEEGRKESDTTKEVLGWWGGGSPQLSSFIEAVSAFDVQQWTEVRSVCVCACVSGELGGDGGGVKKQTWWASEVWIKRGTAGLMGMMGASYTHHKHSDTHTHTHSPRSCCCCLSPWAVKSPSARLRPPSSPRCCWPPVSPSDCSLTHIWVSSFMLSVKSRDSAS